MDDITPLEYTLEKSFQDCFKGVMSFLKLVILYIIYKDLQAF